MWHMMKFNTVVSYYSVVDLQPLKFFQWILICSPVRKSEVNPPCSSSSFSASSSSFSLPPLPPLLLLLLLLSFPREKHVCRSPIPCSLESFSFSHFQVMPLSRPIISLLLSVSDGNFSFKVKNFPLNIFISLLDIFLFHLAYFNRHILSTWNLYSPYSLKNEKRSLH